jgi:O-antigen/teichoic acid export membrane protein
MPYRKIWDLIERKSPPVVQDLLRRLQSSSIGKRLVHGTIWSLVGTVTARFLGLLAAVLVARIIGKSTYGELGIIQSTVGMFGTLAGFGMGTTTTKFVAELRTKDPDRAGRIIAMSSAVAWGISAALAIGLFFLAPWLCDHTLSAPYLKGYLQASVPLLLLSSINGAQIGVLSGFEAFKRMARVNFLTGLITFPLVVGGALRFGLPGIIAGMILAQSAGCLLNLLALRHEAARHKVHISYRSCLTELPVLWSFSLPAVCAHLLISVVSWAAAAMLVRQPNGLAEMGAFNAANQWFNALMWLPYMLTGVALPMLSERLGADDRHGSFRLLRMSVKMNAAITVPLVLVGSLLSPFIMMSYGPGFRSAWPTLICVLFAAGLLSIDLPLGELITASGKMWVSFASNIAWGTIFLGGTYGLLHYGSLGLASARMFAYLMHVLWSFTYVSRLMARSHQNALTPSLDPLATSAASAEAAVEAFAVDVSHQG